jgi:hypothetical protein
VAWFHQHQFAALRTAPGKAFPILAWEISSDEMHIISVKLMIAEKDNRWFDIGQVMLFRSNSEFKNIFDKSISDNKVMRFLKSFGKRR